MPPVTEAEFVELRAWLEANHRSIDAAAELIDLGNYQTTAWSLLPMMRKHGSRTTDAGDLADAVRRLQAKSDPLAASVCQ